MASTTLNGYTFTTTGSGDTIVTGKGIQGSGISLGYTEELTPSSFSRAASSPNVDDTARKALSAFQNDPTLITTLQSQLSPAEPETPKQKEEVQAGQKIKEPDAATSKQGENKKPDDAKPNASKTPPQGDLSGNLYAKTAGNQAGASVPSKPGKRTWNPLGDFSSYTYRISLYALSPDAYNAYKKTGQWDKTQLSLIVQSGGIANDQKLDAPRGQGFDLDFYIDDLEVTANVNAKENAMATNAFAYKFKVYEPYGMTFPKRLIDLQQQLRDRSYAKDTEAGKYVQSTHGAVLLVIRFYGYDANGQIMDSSKYNTGSFSRQLDEGSTFERYFTLNITAMNYRLEGRGAVYDITAVTFDQQVGCGTKRGILDDAPSALGATVQEMLGGVEGTTTGLIDRLNQQQQKLKGKSVEIPDEYAIVYEEGSTIKTAKMVDASLNKNRVPMTQVKSPSSSNAKASANTSSMKPQRTITFTKGTPIIQAIDQVISQSSYIDDALSVLDSEDAQPIYEGDQLTDLNSKPKTLQWYMITPHVEILGYDKIRNDYAYKITYVIQTYDVPYVQSANIKYVPKYPGPHKVYNYWYTGKNSEVLSYDVTMNNAYFVYSSIAYDNSKPSGTVTAPVQPKTTNNADPMGRASGTSEGASSIKAFLYSPADQQNAKIKILGDPDFLMQTTSGTIGEMMNKNYGPNFTINPNTGQIFIEIIFNQVEDYSNKTGLIEPFGGMVTQSKTATPTIAQISRGSVYMVLKVVSKFSKGKFIQEFQTSYPQNFDTMKPGDEAKVAAGGSSAANRAETANKPKITPGDSDPKLAAAMAKFKKDPNSVGDNSGGKDSLNRVTKQIETFKKQKAKPNDDQVLQKQQLNANTYEGRVD